MGLLPVELYNVGNRIMNTYVYHTPAGYIMIDTGYEHSFGTVERRLNERGIELSDVSYVFLTHAHDDHAGFLNELLSKSAHIKVIMSGRAMPALLRGQNSFSGGCSGLAAWTFCKLMGLAGKGRHSFPPIQRQYLDRFIELSPQNLPHMEALLQGSILFTPGHTSDSISLKAGNVIFCGDAAMNGVPSLKRITIWIEDKQDFQNSWDLLIDKQADFIYPAHGKPFRSCDLKKYKHCISKVRLYPLK